MRLTGDQIDQTKISGMSPNMHFLKSQAVHLFWLTLVLTFRCDPTGSSQLSLHMPPLPRLFGGLVNHNTIKLIQATHATCPKYESPAIERPYTCSWFYRQSLFSVTNQFESPRFLRSSTLQAIWWTFGTIKSSTDPTNTSFRSQTWNSYN